MPSWCRQVNWENCRIPWVNCTVLCVKDDWKRQFWRLRYYLSKLRSLLSFSVSYGVTQQNRSVYLRVYSALYIVICDFNGPKMIFKNISYTVRFLDKSYWTQNVCFDSLYNFCLKHILFEEDLSDIYIRLYIKYPLFLSYLNKNLIFWTYFRKTFKYTISRKSVQWEPNCSMRS
jgi:hypothetical protein